MNAGTALLVFAKSPRPGMVKTRMIPGLSASQAAALHERLVNHALAAATASGLGPVTLCCAPDTCCERLCELARAHGAALEPQRGADLGERMAAAIRQALRRASRVLLMGSDCPGLDGDTLVRADAALGRGADVVLVPAVDGGYVLIGAARPCDAVFDDIPWGSAAVLARTRERLVQVGLGWHELTPLRDVDRIQDLDLLPEKLRRGLCWEGGAPKF